MTNQTQNVESNSYYTEDVLKNINLNSIIIGQEIKSIREEDLSIIMTLSDGKEILFRADGKIGVSVELNVQTIVKKTIYLDIKDKQ